ncbi:MAG: hypothetical protein HQM16_03550 [Deltaproteobacteria bacterium]|nr:hypothetical protein [Deltaproteobacteria bacterium]
MNHIKTIRIPNDLEQAMKYVSDTEKIEKSQSLRKLASMGFESYIIQRYQLGKLTLRECAKLLNLPLSEVIILMLEHGVTGNIKAQDVMNSLG